MSDEFLYLGYEDLEISTQLLLKEADNMGIEWTILDRPANFIKLKKGSHIEYVKEASKTRLDSYMTFLIMENKIVSKLLLSEAGLTVPKGFNFYKKEDAYKSFDLFQDIKKVIKPVTTNFGLGIEISPAYESKEEFMERINRAFQYSESIIIEEFIEGKEYRFLVLGDKTVAVCNRVPANVVGDGTHSISELVDLKNKDPRRGVGHRTPLEKIQKSPIETEILKSQGYTWESIPPKNQIVYLRRNSNISTGGDSIDTTDQVHPEFNEIAERAAKAVQAQICGVDIISSNIEDKPKPNSYAILEVNFNPVLYIHDYPYNGKNRRVAKKILELLGYK